MNFPEARETSTKFPGMHVRRAGWVDKWFIWWRGLVFCQGSNYSRTVKNTDYTPEDLRATDWTSMPAALAACPVGGGSTGGGSIPPPGAPPGTPPGGGGSPPTIPPPPGGGTPGPGSTPPPSDDDPDEDPQPPTRPSCSFGSLSLVGIVNETGGIDVELTAAGLSSGSYSVKYAATTSLVGGGLHSGPNFTDSATVPINSAFAWREITITAMVTGFSGGPCQGMQATATTKVQYYPPNICPPPWRTLSATISVAKRDGWDYPPPSGALLTFNSGESVWKGQQTLSYGEGEDQEFIIYRFTAACGSSYGDPVGGYISVSSDLTGVVGGGSFTPGGTATIDESTYFTSGTASWTVKPLP